jgi:uncharacterized membrane protein YhaH (DUF805 family)
MKRYFYILDGKRIGPLSFEEIKATDISEETLVWYEGLENWQPAGKLGEFLYLSVRPEETKPVVEDSVESIEIIEPLIRDEPVSTQEAISENAVIAVDNAPVVYQNSVESQLKAYTSSMNQYHGIDDPFASAQHQMIYPKQPMFSNPFGFKGRIRRTEYWLSIFIGYVYLFFVLGLVGYTNGSSNLGSVGFLFLIPFYWFLIAQNTKRCHDRGNSGWFQIIPFYGLWMAFGESDRFVNDYGPNPKGDNFQTRF